MRKTHVIDVMSCSASSADIPVLAEIDALAGLHDENYNQSPGTRIDSFIFILLWFPRSVKATVALCLLTQSQDW